MEKRKVRILLIGAFSEIFIKMLKEIFPSFEVDKIEPQKCSDTYFLDFIQERFRPRIILIHPQDYEKNPEFYKGLQKQFFKVCFRRLVDVDLWRKNNKLTKKMLEMSIGRALKELEEKNK